MKRYDSYKPCGISWIGEIPSHWDESRLYSICSVKSITGCQNENLLSVFLGKGIVPFNSEGARRTNAITETTDLSKYQLVEPGDFVLNNQQAWRGSVGVSTLRGIISPAYIVLSFDKDINPQFCDYSLQSNHMISQFFVYSKGVGSIQRNISWNDLKNSVFPIPPLEEQKKIVEFLSTKTSLIDEQQREKERELRLLDELKKAEIANVVTRGLNPDVPMKDSGIPWIGQIPAHWEIKYLFQFAKEHNISNKDIHHQNLLSLSYGRIIRKDINTTDGLLPESFDTYQVVEPGNIILRLTDLQNDHKSLRVGLVAEEGIITSAYVCLEINDDYIPAYFYNMLHSFDLKKVFYSMGGGLRQNLNYQGLRKLEIVLPPIEEQKAIVEYIQQKNTAIDEMIANLRAEIDFLTEYKQRLIAEVVTGQINVQNL